MTKVKKGLDSSVKAILFLALGLFVILFTIKITNPAYRSFDKSSAAGLTKSKTPQTLVNFWPNPNPIIPALYDINNWSPNNSNHAFMDKTTKVLSFEQGTTTTLPYIFHPNTIGNGITYYDGTPVYVQVYGYVFDKSPLNPTSICSGNWAPFGFFTVWIDGNNKYNLSSTNNPEFQGWSTHCMAMGNNQYSFAIEGVYPGPAVPNSNLVNLFAIRFYNASVDTNDIWQFHKVNITREPVPLNWPNVCTCASGTVTSNDCDYEHVPVCSTNGNSCTCVGTI